MGPYQLWIAQTLARAEGVAAFMRGDWGWPGAESVHFMGLTLLFGSIAAWDLRLLGVARSVPIEAFHRLVPFAVAGFLINAASGSLFLMTEPDQYVYNPAFHAKLLFMGLAGVNVLAFYLLIFRPLRALGPGAPLPALARVSGLVSLACWGAVIICGRLITFYRPIACDETMEAAAGFLVDCIMR